MKRVRSRPSSAPNPILPLGLGYAEGITHDYIRYGTTTLFAALDIQSGVVLTRASGGIVIRRSLVRRPRFHLHFTPTYASWLNHVERWFGLITQRAIRRGSFRTVRELIRRIDTFITHYNSTAGPFAWTATADSILAIVERLAKAINGTSH